MDESSSFTSTSSDSSLVSDEMQREESQQQQREQQLRTMSAEQVNEDEPIERTTDGPTEMDEDSSSIVSVVGFGALVEEANE